MRHDAEARYVARMHDLALAAPLPAADSPPQFGYINAFPLPTSRRARRDRCPRFAVRDARAGGATATTARARRARHIRNGGRTTSALAGRGDENRRAPEREPSERARR